MKTLFEKIKERRFKKILAQMFASAKTEVVSWNDLPDDIKVTVLGSDDEFEPNAATPMLTYDEITEERVPIVIES